MREHTHTYAHASRRLREHTPRHKPKATSTHTSTYKRSAESTERTYKRGHQCVPRSMGFGLGLMLEHGLFVTSFLPVRTFALSVALPLTAPLVAPATCSRKSANVCARFGADAPPWVRVTRFRMCARPSLNIYYPPSRNFSAFFLGFTHGLNLLFLQGVLTLQFCELPL